MKPLSKSFKSYKMFKLFAFLTVTIFILSGCAKYEGTGGKSSINGKIVLNQRLYVNGALTDSVTLSGAKEDVYIVYGDGVVGFDDKVECSHDGTFKFDYLQPGTYTIFAYSELFHAGPNPTNNDDDYYTNEAVKVTIELGKKEVFEAGTITLIK
jgi:hypothetical protein